MLNNGLSYAQTHFSASFTDFISNPKHLINSIRLCSDSGFFFFFEFLHRDFLEEKKKIPKFKNKSMSIEYDLTSIVHICFYNFLWIFWATAFDLIQPCTMFVYVREYRNWLFFSSTIYNIHTIQCPQSDLYKYYYVYICAPFLA